MTEGSSSEFFSQQNKQYVVFFVKGYTYLGPL